MKSRLFPAVSAAVFVSLATADATVIFTSDFEGLGNTDDNTLATYDKYPPSPANWDPSNTGYKSSDAGANLVGTNSVWSFRYTNSGLTSKDGVIGSLTAGMTITVTFDAFLDTGGADGGEIGIVTFDGTLSRTDTSGGMVKNTSSVLTSSGFSAGTGNSITYTADGTEGTIGDDVAIRFIGATTSANIDNVTVNVTSVPEPSIAFLGSLGLLGLLRRRRA